MIIAAIFLVIVTFLLAPLHIWQGALLLPLACAIVGSAFGAWRFVVLWVGLFLLIALTQTFPWIDFAVLLSSIGVTAWVVSRFLHQEQGVPMIATLGLIFLITVWVQSSLTLGQVYHVSMIGSFLFTLPFIIGMVLWFTYPKRRLI